MTTTFSALRDLSRPLLKELRRCYSESKRGLTIIWTKEESTYYRFLADLTRRKHPNIAVITSLEEDTPANAGCEIQFWLFPSEWADLKKLATSSQYRGKMIVLLDNSLQASYLTEKVFILSETGEVEEMEMDLC